MRGNVECQIEALVTLANQGYADMAIVGSETQYRGDLTASQLIAYINEVRSRIPSSVPVTTADTYGALQNEQLLGAVDLVMANIYPYWEGVPLDQAVRTLHQRYLALKALSKGREVFISEAGWPSCGSTIGGAVPSPENAASFFLNFTSWVRAENIKSFYFEAFDEPWKVKHEGPQGGCWGVWTEPGTLKAGMERVFNGETVSDNWSDPKIGGPGIPRIEYTGIPPLGTSQDLFGRVFHVNPASHRIAAYIKVGSGWWTKPFFAAPVTGISSNGTFQVDVTTGGSDSQASEIATFLIPQDYSPPTASNSSILPPALFSNSLDHLIVNRTIRADRAPLDFDGNGVSDFGVFYPPSATWIVQLKDQNGSTLGARIKNFGAANLSDLPIPGDYDGNGVSDLSVFRVSTGEWLTWLNDAAGNRIGARVTQFGGSNLLDLPVPGDYDGNGVSDLAVFRSPTAEWLITLREPDGSRKGVRIIQFGAPPPLSDIPVPGDYDGNGITDLAVYRPITGQWLIWLMNSAGQRIGARVIAHGRPNLVEVPVPGDFDGNGVTDLAAFNPNGAIWHITLRNQDGRIIGDKKVQFGAPNYIHIPLHSPIAALKLRGVF